MTLPLSQYHQNHIPLSTLSPSAQGPLTMSTTSSSMDEDKSGPPPSSTVDHTMKTETPHYSHTEFIIKKKKALLQPPAQANMAVPATGYPPHGYLVPGHPFYDPLANPHQPPQVPHMASLFPFLHPGTPPSEINPHRSSSRMYSAVAAAAAASASLSHVNSYLEHLAMMSVLSSSDNVPVCSCPTNGPQHQSAPSPSVKPPSIQTENSFSSCTSGGVASAGGTNQTYASSTASSSPPPPPSSSSAPSNSRESAEQSQSKSLRSPRSIHMAMDTSRSRLCEICSDISSGFHCNVFVCEACKKFFIRSCKANAFTKYTCAKSGTCEVNKNNRTHCQFCRYQKCCRAKMTLPGTSPTVSLLDKGALPCRVCGAVSSGFHFGAFTCEGCKGFFRRSIQECEKRQYVCEKGGKCVMSPTNRNNCKACRFEKCLRVGMCREGSRIGRQPNALKFIRYQEMEKLSSSQSSAGCPGTCSVTSEAPSGMEQDETEESYSPSTASTTATTPAAPLPDSTSTSFGRPRAHSVMGELHQSVTSTCNSVVGRFNGAALPSCKFYRSQSDEQPRSSMKCEYSNEKNYDFIQRCNDAASALRGNMERRSADWSNGWPPKDTELWRIMMKHFEIHTMHITNFAKKVPGFEELHLKDKKTVVKDSLYPIILLCLSRDFNPGTQDYNYFDFTPAERDLILAMFPSFHEVGRHLCESGRMLHHFKLDDVEMALLATIALFKRESPVTQDSERIDHMYNMALGALNYYEEKIRMDHERGGQLVSALLRLSHMNAEHHQIVRELKSHRPELPFPKLYAEVFHLHEMTHKNLF